MQNEEPWNLFNFEIPEVKSRFTKSLNVPGKQQTNDYTCGFACVVMILSYFKCLPDSLKTLYQKLGTTENGTDESQIISCLRDYGIHTKQKTAMETYHIKNAINNRQLLIVYSHSLDHWSVVCGYKRYKAILADPSNKSLTEMTWQQFRSLYTGYHIICQIKKKDIPYKNSKSGGPPPYKKKDYIIIKKSLY